MPGKSDWVFHVSEPEFDEKVLKKSHDVPIVVDFWAPWCGPCRALTPILEGAIEKRNGEVLLAKVNTDEAQNLAMEFGVNGIPHVVGIRKGRVVVQFTGLVQEAQLAQFFDRLKPSEAEKDAETAAQIEKTNPAEAERVYRLALKNDSNQEAAMVGLARVLIEQKKFDEIPSVLEPIGPHSEHTAEAEKLRAISWLWEQAKGLANEDALREKVNAEPKNADALYALGCVLAANSKFEEGLESLFQAGQLDRKLASSKIRETMVKIFFVVGVRSDLADAYRDKLRSLLY